MKKASSIPAKTIPYMINLSQMLLESNDTADEHVMCSAREVWRHRDPEPA